jgi:ketosteroid isomerase-like protein
MKKFYLLIIFIGLLQSGYSQMTSGLKIKIEELENSWHHAYEVHDVRLIRNVLADDFINLGRTGGRISKQQTLENFKKDSAIYEYCKPFDFEFRKFKKTVIVLCKTKEKGIDHGKPFEALYFSYDIFVKRKGKWKCVQAGVATIPKKN